MSQVMVIVLNHNKRDMVLECLQSLAQQAYAAIDVVVFDNASTDKSQDAIRDQYPEIDLVCSTKNLGAAGGRNAAVKYAEKKYAFEYLLFLDDDAETEINSVETLVNALNEDLQAGLACGKTFTSRNSPIIMSAGITEKLYRGRCADRGAGEEDIGQFEESMYVDACGAFAFMIRAELFEELNGFDEIYSPYGWEDVDICLRARNIGYRTRYVHNAVFFHKGTRLGRKPVPAYERNKARNFFTLLIRHTSVPGKIAAAFFVPVIGLILFVKFAIRGDWRAIPAQLSGVVDLLLRRKNRTE